MEPQLYTVEETAALLKVSKMTIYRLIKARKLGAYKVGNDYRISKENIDHFLDAGKIKVSNENP